MVTDNTSQADDTTAFLRAARSGDLERVIEYLDTNLDINTANSNGLNALHLASKDGHVEIVTELLKRGAKVDAATKKGNTALHIASLAGQTEIVNILIQYGAAVNIQSQNGFTPLYMAAQENHDHVVKLLLNNGANQSLATEDGFTPLAVAMQQGHDKVVSVLLENDSKGKVRLPALHIAARKDDCKAADLLLQNDHKPDVTSKSGFTPLHIAAHYGNEEIARLLIKRGADVNYLAKHNISPLHVAAKWGKNNLVKILLENSAIIDAKTRDGLTPLHCAARSGHEQVITTLLEHSAPISARTKNGLAPLHMASQGDHVGAARALLYHRAPVDEVTIDYLTSLHVAAHCGHVRVAKLLLDRKADPNARALNGFTPLHIACKKNRIKVVELLLKHGASIESTTESGLTPLHVASFMGCMNIVIFLLQHEANPDVPTVRGETPLHLAARANQTDIIRILLRNGAKVDARARELQTPLHIAARLGNVDIVMLLLQHGAAVDTATKDMYTALHVAAKEGQEEVAAILLDNNASINATTTNGFTPLHFAAKYGNMNVAKLLLQKDSKLEAQDKYGITPLHLACHYNHPNVAQLLLEKGASPHTKSQNCFTPLHIVARKNQMDIASTLLEHGANPNVQSRAGFTPLHLSAQRGHYDMTNLLIEHGADVNKQASNGLSPLHLCAQEDFTKVASVLVKYGANVESKTVTDYRPIHVAAHFGNLSMIRFLLKHNADVNVKTTQNYTPLHQAAQQGHAHVVSALIEANAWHRARTNDGLTALNIVQKLGYISVMEVLKGLPYDGITPDNKNWEEKYKVIAPESLQETSLMSDSEDEGGSEALISEQPYQYLTLDLMKSLQDDSLPIDVTGDDPTHKQQLLKQEKHEFIQSSNYCFAENFDSHDSSSSGLQYRPFLVSFLVDARGGAMKGCRHSGIRIVVPPRRAPMPIRITCKLVKPNKVPNPPPQMDGEALATRIVEMGPVGVSFLGPVLIDIPHSASVSGKEREIIIMRSDNGETWKEHDNSADNDDNLMNSPYDSQMSASHTDRITRIVTTELPQYFAVITRIRQEVHVIGAEGGILISSVAEHVQAVFPPGALTKKIKVGLQAHVIPTELTAKLLGNCVAVSPVVTIEPRRRKFHKPITITMPVPQAANKGTINQYAGETPTLRLLYSIAGGTSEAQWEDVTGSTPLTFMNDRISFTTTVSARFLLMDCRNISEVPKMATELYKESLFVPFVTNFIIYSKRVDIVEAMLRILCMTDGKDGIHTLEKQERFKEIVKSRDVEVLDGKELYIEFSGNLVPVTKSGSQLKFTFKAFRQNRLSFHVKVKDPLLDPVARMLFMREPKVAKGEPAQQPICVLNILLPEAVCSRQSKIEGAEDSNIISQKMDLLKSKQKEDNEEKRDEPKSASPSEKKFITDTLQKEHSDAAIHEFLAQKAACSLESVDASYPTKVSGQDDTSPSLENQTYSEKRKFWEDIARKRDSYQRSESEVSRTSQLTYNESDSDYLQNVISEDETEAISAEIKSEIVEDVNVPDISECSVAEKAHYFEEQIQKELSTIKQLPKKSSISDSMSKSAEEAEIKKDDHISKDKRKSKEDEFITKDEIKEKKIEKEMKLMEKDITKDIESILVKDIKKEKEIRLEKDVEQGIKDVKREIQQFEKKVLVDKKDIVKEIKKDTKTEEKDMKIIQKDVDKDIQQIHKEKKEDVEKMDIGAEKKVTSEAKEQVIDETIKIKQEMKDESKRKQEKVEEKEQEIQKQKKMVDKEKEVSELEKKEVDETVEEVKKVDQLKKEIKEKEMSMIEEIKGDKVIKSDEVEKTAVISEKKLQKPVKSDQELAKSAQEVIDISIQKMQKTMEGEIGKIIKEEEQILHETIADVSKSQEFVSKVKETNVMKDDYELEALKSQAEKEIEEMFITKIEEKRLSQMKSQDQSQEKPDSPKVVKKEFESRIPISASMAEKDKKHRQAESEDDHLTKKTDVKSELESRIPKLIPTSSKTSVSKKTTAESKSDKILKDSTEKDIFDLPNLQKAEKLFEESNLLAGTSNIISKVDRTELITHETKEIKSSEVLKGLDKTVLHEEKEHIVKKKTQTSSITKHSPEEIITETARQIKESDKMTTQQMAINITDDKQVIDAKASGISLQNKENKIVKLQEDKDKIVMKESDSSQIKEKTVDVSLKFEKDLLDKKDIVDAKKIFTEDKDISGFIREKSVQEASREESSESSTSKVNLKGRPQTLIPEKVLDWKDSSSINSSIDEFVEEEQKLLIEESRARDIAETLLQSIENEIQNKSIEELRKVHSQEMLEQIDETADSESLDDKLADNLTKKFEHIMQKDSGVRSLIHKPILEKESRRDSASFSEDITKDEESSFSYLSSSQAQLQDRDITMSPSSISEHIEVEEADITSHDVENVAKAMKSDVSDRIVTETSSQSYYPETEHEIYETHKYVPKEYSEISGAKVLEILEPGIQSRQDSMDVPSLEIDDIKLSERVSQDFGVSRSQEAKDSGHTSFHESTTVDSLEKMYVDRDITISPSTVSEDTNLDYSLTREERASIGSKNRKGDSFEIESPPMISPRLKIKELEINPVDWMIGDEKIEISETLQPSQAFNKELEEYESSLLQKQQSKEDKTDIACKQTDDLYETKISEEEKTVSEQKSSITVVKSKFTVIPVTEQDLEKELIENKLDISCQELVATLQREYDAKTPTKEDRLDDFQKLGDDQLTEEEKSDEESIDIMKSDSQSQPDSFDAVILVDDDAEKKSQSSIQSIPLDTSKSPKEELIEAERKTELQKLDSDIEDDKVCEPKISPKKKKDESYTAKIKLDDHKRLGEKLEKREKVGQSDVSAFKLTTENLQNVDLSAKYAITVLDQVVKKEIAEVKESLEAAKQDLIEELSENSETVLQIKDSPSEFQFKLQPEPIPNELPFLYKAPSVEHEADRDSVASGSPVAKPRKQDSRTEKVKDSAEADVDETLKVKLSDEISAILTSTADTEPRITVLEDVRDEESPLPISRSGSDAENKDDNIALLTPQPAPRRRHRPLKSRKLHSESEADVGSSSGESSQYQSCEYESGSRPSSSDVEALQSTVPSGTLSEYETALMSVDHSSDTRATSQDYHTAVSSLSSRESMKSLNSLSSGHLGSIDSTSELSETLVASDAEMEKEDEENQEFGLDEEEVGEYKVEGESEEGMYESQETEIPFRMKRSSEMIFQQISEDTTTLEEQVSEDVESYEYKPSAVNETEQQESSEVLKESKPSQQVSDAKPDEEKHAEETSEYYSATFTQRSGRQSPTLESIIYERKRSISNLDDEGFDTTFTPSGSLIQQASMSTSSASGISADTIVDKEKDRHSPDSDSFEIVDKPDIIDDFVVIEEVGKEAEECDAEGKSIRIRASSYSTSKNYDREVEKMLTATKKEEEAIEETSNQRSSNNELFELESEESPPQASNEDQYSQSYSDEEQYDGNKKWIEMQFQSDARMYEVEYDRGPLEDIKEEEITDFEAGSSRFGSLGSHKESIGSVGSMRGSFGSTPDYETLTKKYFIKPTDHDNVSLSSLQEFEHLETAIAMENSSKKHSGSQDSSSGNGSFPRRYVSKSGHGDDISLSSLKDFEGLEKACREAHLIELKAREEQELLDHESPENRYKLEMARVKAESSSTVASVNPSTSGSDDYEKRVKEIEEIIRIAQANVEKLERQDDTQEDISQIEEVEKAVATTSTEVEVARPSTELNVMETSTDSLELEDNGNQNYNPMCRSSDSLELKTTLDYPSLSSDSLNNMRDPKESQLDSSERYNNSRRISSDSLELPEPEVHSHSQDIDYEGNIPQTDRQFGETVREHSSQSNVPRSTEQKPDRSGL